MAGTTSATRRQSHVWTAVQAASLERLLAMRTALGKGNATRGIILLTAIVLSLAGCIAPHTDRHVLAALLFFCAAALALVATARSLDEEVTRPFSSQVSPGSASRTAAHCAQPLPRTLQELGVADGDTSAFDPAHWCRMTHRMCHELRTPLNAVLGFSELMASESFGPLGSAQYVEYARAINASGKTLLKSAEDALAITNLLTATSSNERQQPVNIRSALDDMLAFHQLGYDHARLDLSGWNDASCEITGEAQTLRQILINLMAFALDQGGQNSIIRLACVPDAQEVRLSFAVDVDPGNDASVRDDDFSLALARMLIQFSGARMTESAGPHSWCAEVVFQRASQQDFFRMG